MQEPRYIGKLIDKFKNPAASFAALGWYETLIVAWVEPRREALWGAASDYVQAVNPFAPLRYPLNEDGLWPWARGQNRGAELEDWENGGPDALAEEFIRDTLLDALDNRNDLDPEDHPRFAFVTLRSSSGASIVVLMSATGTSASGLTIQVHGVFQDEDDARSSISSLSYFVDRDEVENPFSGRLLDYWWP